MTRAQARDAAGVCLRVRRARGALTRTVDPLPLAMAVDRLAGEEQRTLLRLDHQRLVPRRVPGRGEDAEARNRLVVARDLLDASARKVDPGQDRVVVRGVRDRPLGRL